MSAVPNIYRNKVVSNCIMLFGIAALAFLIYSAHYIYKNKDSHHAGSFILASVWTVGSPAWFFIEHFILFKHFGDPAQYDQFKRGQDLASKIWAGGIGILAVALH